MPYGTAQEGKSDNQSKKQATLQQAGAGQEPPGKAGSQPEKTATGQANNKQQQKSGYGSSSEPRKTTEKSGQAKAAESTKQEKPPLLENLEKNQRQELLGNRHKRSHRRMHSLLIQMKDRKLWSHKNHQRIGEVLEK